MRTKRTEHDAAYAERVAAAWNGVAEARRANCQPPAFFAGGGSVLDQAEVDAVAESGPIAERRLLALDCGSGALGVRDRASVGSDRFLRSERTPSTVGNSGAGA